MKRKKKQKTNTSSFITPISCSSSSSDVEKQVQKEKEEEEQQQLIEYDTSYLTVVPTAVTAKTIVIQTIVTSFSIRLLFYILYVYVIKMETDALIQDIIKLNERFANNSYSRIINELQIFISNSITSNSFDDTYHCAIYGYIKSKTVEESQTFVSEIIKTLTDFKIETDFFTQIYYDSVKKSIGVGPSLETIKTFVLPNQDLYYNVYEKNNLRGAHSQLSELRQIYNKKMNHYYTYDVSSSNDDEEDVVYLFADKIKTLITNPDMMMCNQIISQNKININNLKQNVLAANRLTIKDMYASILDSTDGVISVRIQNSITKSVYCAVLFIILGVLGFIYRKLKRK
jgi:hypothetical protein